MAGVLAGAAFTGADFAAAGALTGAAGDCAETLLATPTDAAGEGFAAAGVLAEAGDAGTAGDALGADVFAFSFFSWTWAEGLVAATDAGFASVTGALAGASSAEVWAETLLAAPTDAAGETFAATGALAEAGDAGTAGDTVAAF